MGRRGEGPAQRELSHWERLWGWGGGAEGLGGQFTQPVCSAPRPTTHPSPSSHANEALSAPGPFELMWRQQVAGAGKKPPEWAGAGRGGAPSEVALGGGVCRPG